MDLGEFRSFVLDSGIDVWTWIDLAISMASADYENDLKNRRDGIIKKLYAPPFSKCQNCDHQLLVKREQNNDLGCDYNTDQILLQGKTVVENEEEKILENEEEDEEQRKVLEIKFLLGDQNQGETCLISLLQKLIDMDITFKVLKETDIGRHVTQFRKHASTEVRRLVKILVRKWKDTVDDWVKMNSPMDEVTQVNAGDKQTSHEPQYKNNHQNGVNGYASSPYYLTPQKQGKVKDKEVESINYSAKKRIHHHQEDQHGLQEEYRE